MLADTLNPLFIANDLIFKKLVDYIASKIVNVNNGLYCITVPNAPDE